MAFPERWSRCRECGRPVRTDGIDLPEGWVWRYVFEPTVLVQHPVCPVCAMVAEVGELL